MLDEEPVSIGLHPAVAIFECLTPKGKRDTTWHGTAGATGNADCSDTWWMLSKLVWTALLSITASDKQEGEAKLELL